MELVFVFYKSNSVKYCLIPLWTLIFALALPVTAHTVLPPQVYKKRALDSQIKAIATVTRVVTDHIGEHASFKTATFSRVYGLTKDTSQTFEASFKSIETPEQKANPMMGGSIYFYPHIGQRVFVTVTCDGGPITSMTTATEELEWVVREDPERIEYGMGKVTIRPGKENRDKADFVPEETMRKSPHMSTHLGKKDSATIDDKGVSQDTYDARQDDLQGQLLLALGDDDVTEAGRLISTGADPVRANAQGMTALMYVESEAMARMLVEHGAAPDCRDNRGNTVLHYAVVKDKAPELIRYFTALGINPNQPNDQGVLPAANAAMYFYETERANGAASAEWVFGALAEGGADLDARSAGGQTLLMGAALRGERRMVELLLKLGVDKSLRDENGKTARDWALESGNEDLAHYLNE